MMLVTPLIKQLEAGDDAPDAASAPALDPSQEDWAPSLLPAADNPALLVDMLGEVFSATSWGEASKKGQAAFTALAGGQPSGPLPGAS